jgi:hypothetical protein
MFSNAYKFEHVAKCGELQCYVRDVDICTQVYNSFDETI